MEVSRNAERAVLSCDRILHLWWRTRTGSTDPVRNIEIVPFLCSAQRKGTKRKGAQSLGPWDCHCPLLLERAGHTKTRFAQTVRAPDHPGSAMLGCGTMGLRQEPVK
jgi:hypothetical protein